jgi:hypothetical protein
MFALLLSEEMDPFYQNIASFPTVIFTVSLAVCVVFWLISMLGFINVDVLDVDLPGGESGVDLNTNTSPGAVGILLKFGLHGVPITIIVSLISVFAWPICYYIVAFFFHLIPDGFLTYLAGIPVLFVSLYAAVLITSFVIRPLRPLFKIANQETTKHVLGQSAIVRTSKVDNKFGEVNFEDGGAGLILKVRTDGQEVFSRGDRVVLYEYLEEENIYRIVSEKEFLGLSGNTGSLNNNNITE